MPRQQIEPESAIVIVARIALLARPLPSRADTVVRFAKVKLLQWYNL